MTVHSVSSVVWLDNSGVLVCDRAGALTTSAAFSAVSIAVTAFAVAPTAFVLLMLAAAASALHRYREEASAARDCQHSQ
jgi:hypothetical protein